jgi:hypothetical protein
LRFDARWQSKPMTTSFFRRVSVERNRHQLFLVYTVLGARAKTSIRSREERSLRLQMKS